MILNIVRQKVEEGRVFLRTEMYKLPGALVGALAVSWIATFGTWVFFEIVYWVAMATGNTVYAREVEQEMLPAIQLTGILGMLVACIFPVHCAIEWVRRKRQGQ